MTRPATPDETLHATCVAWDGRGMLILGPSGAGKSTLALGLMAHGATLVADDRTHVAEQGGQVMAWVPETIRGRIEARGVGLLHAEITGPVPLALVVDLGQDETDRLPPWREAVICGRPLACVHNAGIDRLPALLIQYMRQGRAA
ncbi:HPr kinase/phosphatase C-terminal domain-containing protein [Mesobacterium pallidum]|uniref:HPr kinase/phosphorylase n=1 Tax=Mesobacterium pallidum TaxID=2872037 RepID=UPI00300CF8C1